MSEISAFHFPYHGFSVPNGIPFYPKIKEANGQKKVSFNQGYVFDFTSVRGNKGVRKIKVENCDTEYEAAGKHFHLEIKTTKDLANLSSAQLKEGEASSTEQDHYTAKNIEGDSIYSDGQGIFKIPICQLDSEGAIIEWTLRENVHWQKINFENNQKEPDASESIGVLHNWGDETSFNDNPTVKFANIVEKSKEQIITVEKSNSKKNIVVTTKIPPAPKGKCSVLYRNKEDKFIWLPANEEFTQILYQNDGEMKFLDEPEYPGDSLQFNMLTYDSTKLKWVLCEEKILDVCINNEAKQVTFYVKPDEE